MDTIKDRGMWEIRPARQEDAEGLSKIAERIFRDTFAPFNTPADMDLYSSQTFTPAVFAAAILDPDTDMLVAFHEDRPIAYAHLHSGEAPPEVTGPSPIELKRFYVLQAWHGSGLAKDLMKGVIDRSLERGARTLWLGVWEQNTRAIAFYRKLGFAEVGELIFVLGTDRQRDLMMAIPIGAL
jgi:GNAT superfamily N-acetyltransferase